MRLYKGNSGVKNKGTPVAKSIAEANALAVRLKLANRADFSGIDLDHANLLIQRLADIRQQFPQLPQIEFIGRGVWRVQKSEVPLAWMEASRNRSGIVAESLKLNINFFGDTKKQALQKEYSDSPDKFHPVKCNTPKGSIDHEIGHYLDFCFGGKGLNNDKQILKLYRQNGGTKEEIMRNNVSGYAARNAREFIAECWSEYQNNPNPRPAAKAVSDRIRELYQSKGAK